jgi:hypothetical protein
MSDPERTRAPPRPTTTQQALRNNQQKKILRFFGAFYRLFCGLKIFGFRDLKILMIFLLKKSKVLRLEFI